MRDKIKENCSDMVVKACKYFYDLGAREKEYELGGYKEIIDEFINSESFSRKVFKVEKL